MRITCLKPKAAIKTITESYFLHIVQSRDQRVTFHTAIQSAQIIQPIQIALILDAIK